MSWLSPEAAALIDDARRGLGPAAADTARIRERLAARLPAGALVPAAVAGAAIVAAEIHATATTAVAASAAPTAVATVSTATAATATKVGLGLAAKLALYLGGAAVIAASVHAYDTRRAVRTEDAGPGAAIVAAPAPVASPAPTVVVVPIAIPMAIPVRVTARAAADPTPRFVVVGAAAASPAVAPILAVAPSDAPAPTTASDPRVAERPVNAEVATAAPAEPPAQDPLTRELALVRGAAAALRSGNAITALDELDIYDHAFPTGQLAEEATALRVRALCATDPAAAAAARYRFVARWPQSAQRDAVERACPSLPTP
jgi:hypothetical protein